MRAITSLICNSVIFSIIATNTALAENIKQFNINTIFKKDNAVNVDYGNMYDIDAKKPEVFDPLEAGNRKVFAFNMLADECCIGPVARAYTHVPIEARQSLNNMYANLNYTPTNLLYSAIQLDLEGFMIAFWRFAINSTVGIFGLYDIAGMFGLAPFRKTIDQTLKSYNIPVGPFLVLPILGGSTLTNSLEYPMYLVLSLYNPYAGIVAFSGTYGTPFAFLGPTSIGHIVNRYFIALYPPKILSTRIDYNVLFEDIKHQSIDGYVSLRSFYLNNKNFNENAENDHMVNGRLPAEKPIMLSHLNRMGTEQLGDEWQKKEDGAEYNFS